MVAIEQVSSRESVNYRELVKEVIRRSIARSRMSKGQFAAALSLELEESGPRRGPVHPTQISKWLSGADVPKADVVLATMKLANFTPYQLLAELDYLPSARAQIASIEERLIRLELENDHLRGEHQGKPVPGCPLCAANDGNL